MGFNSGFKGLNYTVLKQWICVFLTLRTTKPLNWYTNHYTTRSR